MTAAMVGNTIGEMMKKGKVPADIAKYGTDVEHVFVLAAKLKDKYGKDFERIPTGTIGMITYFDRLNAGLQQLMAGARKGNAWSCAVITRSRRSAGESVGGSGTQNA